MPNGHANYYTKEGVEYHEYEMHKYVYDLDILNVPKIVDYNKMTKTMVMERINGLSLSDFYGEEARAVPEEMFEQARDIIKTLVLYNIEYPDITGYNFILDENEEEVWIIDFEHAKRKNNIRNRFITSFCEGKNTWNRIFG